MTSRGGKPRQSPICLSNEGAGLGQDYVLLLKLDCQALQSCSRLGERWPTPLTTRVPGVSSSGILFKADYSLSDSAFSSLPLEDRSLSLKGKAN